MGMNEMREKLQPILEALYWQGRRNHEIPIDSISVNPEIDKILSLETETHRIAVIKKGEPLLLICAYDEHCRSPHCHQEQLTSDIEYYNETT